MRWRKAIQELTKTLNNWKETIVTRRKNVQFGPANVTRMEAFSSGDLLKCYLLLAILIIPFVALERETHAELLKKKSEEELAVPAKHDGNHVEETDEPKTKVKSIAPDSPNEACIESVVKENEQDDKDSDAEDVVEELKLSSDSESEGESS